MLTLLESECRDKGKPDYYDLFRRRIIEPALQGTEPPPMIDEARALGVTEKKACNRLVTVRRAYQRLLRHEIRCHATSEEDVAAEVNDLFAFLATS